MEKLKRFFNGMEITLMLDVGTGTGHFIEILKEVFPRIKLTGIDPNAESLKEAAIKFPDVTFLEMGAEKLEFSDNSFDLASISMALHHVPDVQKALKELQRVVKPGGWIIINELFSDNLNPSQEVHKMYHHFRSKIDRLTGVSHNETFKKKEIIDLVKKSGVKIVFEFENSIETPSISDSGELEEKIEKMKQNLDRVIGLPEFDILKPEINKFRELVLKFGFQPPPRVVLVGNPGK